MGMVTLALKSGLFLMQANIDKIMNLKLWQTQSL